MGEVVPLEHCVASVVSAALTAGVPFPCLKRWCAMVSIALQVIAQPIPQPSEQLAMQWLAVFNQITAKLCAL